MKSSPTEFCSLVKLYIKFALLKLSKPLIFVSYTKDFPGTMRLVEDSTTLSAVQTGDCILVGAP